jgi:hypothetical protein
MLSRKIKIEINQLKENNLKLKLTQLESFNQSTSKHWKALDRLNNLESTKRKPTYFKEGNQTTNEDREFSFRSLSFFVSSFSYIYSLDKFYLIYNYQFSFS